MMINRGFLAGSLLLAALLAACGGDSAADYAKAKQAFAARDYIAARADLNAVLKAEPDNAQALEMMARTMVRLDDGVGAIAMLDRLERLGRLPADHRILRGDANIFSGRFDQAIAAVEGDQTAEAWRIRALARVGLNQPDKAQAAFAQGETAAGPKAALQATHARFVLDAGNIDQARQLTASALAQQADNLVALLVQARIAGLERQPARALAIYRQLAKANPGRIDITFGLIDALGAMRRFDEIEPVLKGAEQLAPDHPKLLYYKARLAAERHEWSKVRELLQPKETFLSEMPELQLLYAQALLEIGQVEQARAYLSPLLLRAPDNDFVRILLARSQLAGDDPYAAAETLRPAAQSAEPDPRIIKLFEAAMRQATAAPAR
ncbi:MAG: tetratricopeptide repeat protein [Novosphingobium sp.]|nr:tetratricopeptide repeat protein [Novosphingobium sp.]